MNRITKQNVEQLTRWLNLQTKAYKESQLFFKNLEMDVENLAFILGEGVHVDDIRKIVHILDISVDEVFVKAYDDTQYHFKYWIMWNGVEVYSIYKEVIK